LINRRIDCTAPLPAHPAHPPLAKTLIISWPAAPSSPASPHSHPFSFELRPISLSLPPSNPDLPLLKPYPRLLCCHRLVACFLTITFSATQTVSKRATGALFWPPQLPLPRYPSLIARLSYERTFPAQESPVAVYKQRVSSARGIGQSYTRYFLESRLVQASA